MYAEEGQALGARADADVAAALQANEALQAQVEAQAVIIARKTERITRLRAALAECRGTDPAALIGSSLPGGEDEWDGFIAQIGHDLAIRRSYKPEGAFPTTFDRTQAGFDVGKRASHWSFKFATGSGYTDWPRAAAGEFDQVLTSIADSVPDDHQALFTPHHEPDGGGGLTQDGPPRDFRAMWQHLWEAVWTPVNDRRKARGARPILVGPVVMRGTLVYRREDMNRWIPPADQIDFVGWDGYGEGVPTLDFTALFDPCYTWGEQNRPGIPMVVGETGPWSYPSGSRADWIADFVADARSHIAEGRLLAACYWNSGQNALTSPDEFAALGS